MGIIQDHGHTMRNIVLCLYSLSCLVRATAQYLSYSGQAYTVFDEKTFYFMQQRNGLDFFSLDLTRSWKAAKAPLQTLPALPFEMSDAEAAPLVINNDKKSLIYFNSNWTPSVFNITTKTWRLGTHLTTHNSTMAESSDYSNYAAIDPSTGIAYIPSSFDTLLYTYNTFQGYTSNVTKAIVPAGPGLHINSAVWSTVRRSLLCYGSTGPDDDPNTWTTMEYQPSTNQWTNHVAAIQERFYFHAWNLVQRMKSCKASVMLNGGPSYSLRLIAFAIPQNQWHPAYNGTKIVMFGTYTIPYPIFILDVKTLVWTKGAEPKPGYDRMHAACAVVGDYLIVAGGTFTSVNKQQVVVYNIKLNQWTDSYEAPQTPTTSTGMETTSPFAEQGQPSGEGMLTGAKIAIIAGASSALVILLICGAFLIRQRKMRRLSQADVLDEDLLKSNLGRMEKARNNPNYPAYPGEDMNNSTLDPSKNPQQQRTIQNEAPRPYTSQHC
ncbi:hypothetical protein KVV02_004672 [Mortierella alpina]|uniref:Kelch repeat protein n=1 Tax=Mortierella alpina TaxID=64518 RepID=A0A9P8A6F9_MORAP|nr:hypothetical protein KVV02_004672 [Mortierella alpina]